MTVGYDCSQIDYSDDFYNDLIQDCYEQATTTREKYSFYYFHVTIEPGYYEGFSIDIEHNFSWCYDSSEDKRLAQKEITQIKRFLLDCIENFGCCVVFPGWCTGYADYKESIEYLNAAVLEMREAVKQTPTWARLPAGERW